VLEVLLNVLVRELTPDQPLGVEDGVGRVLGRLVLGRVADEALARARSEADVRGRDAVALVVGQDLNASILLDSAGTKTGRAR